MRGLSWALPLLDLPGAFGPGNLALVFFFFPLCYTLPTTESVSMAEIQEDRENKKDLFQAPEITAPMAK